MNVGEIKDEIRKLSRTDKIEIYRWLDDETAADLLLRIGANRSLEIRQEIEQKRRGCPPKKRMMSKRTKHRLAGNALSSGNRW
jgi:hypothetical protein